MQLKTHNSPTILIVEDESLIGMMIEDMLVPAGFNVVHAINGHQAAAIADADTALAAVVVDLNLGNGIDGREVLRRIRRRHPDLPAVISTGFDADATQADLRGLGGPTLRLQKPFDDDALLSTLADVMNRRIGEHLPPVSERRQSAAR